MKSKGILDHLLSVPYWKLSPLTFYEDSIGECVSRYQRAENTAMATIGLSITKSKVAPEWTVFIMPAR